MKKVVTIYLNLFFCRLTWYGQNKHLNSWQRHCLMISLLWSCTIFGQLSFFSAACEKNMFFFLYILVAFKQKGPGFVWRCDLFTTLPLKASAWPTLGGFKQISFDQFKVHVYRLKPINRFTLYFFCFRNNMETTFAIECLLGES